MFILFLMENNKNLHEYNEMNGRTNEGYKQCILLWTLISIYRYLHALGAYLLWRGTKKGLSRKRRGKHYMITVNLIFIFFDINIQKAMLL